MNGLKNYKNNKQNWINEKIIIKMKRIKKKRMNFVENY